MNNGPEEIGMDGEAEPGAEGISEPALEAMLRTQLREPLALPAGFKERVLARAAAEASGPVAVAERPVAQGRGATVLLFRRPGILRMVAGGALAASLLAGTFGVEVERRHREAAGVAARERAVANQQFEQASRITDEALAHTREQLQHAGVFDDEGR